MAFPGRQGDILEGLGLRQVLVIEDDNLATLAEELIQLVVTGMNVLGVKKVALGLLVESRSSGPRC